jgi:hypothetical protein
MAYGTGFLSFSDDLPAFHLLFIVAAVPIAIWTAGEKGILRITCQHRTIKKAPNNKARGF